MPFAQVCDLFNKVVIYTSFSNLFFIEKDMR
jgi:hypothetical protein